nr:hypothetical protein [Tanacetum cinerariifolium]
MNQNNEVRQLSVFVIDANDDETYVVFLEQAYAYHQQLVAEENRLPLTRNLINHDREGAEERLMADYFNDHCRGDKKKYPAIMLEAVASQDLWIWHAFFGVAGANNDINILDNYLLFDDLLNDTAPVLPYVVNGVGYEKRYYLVDCMYPQRVTFVKSFTVANDVKHAYFKKRQEGARKDVERAFGVLQGRWE